MTIEQARESQEEYQARPEVRAQLGTTAMIPIVGALAVGKNFLMQASGLPIVGNETSRQQRMDDDPNIYTYSTNEEMLRAVQEREYVQYGVFLPDTIYATRLEHYTLGEPNVKDIWHDSAHTLENKGFQTVKTVGVLTPGAQWLSQMMLRVDGMSQGSINDRLSEARRSTRWIVTKQLSGAKNHLVVINTTNNTDENIDRIRRFSEGEAVPSLSDDQITNVANEMYKTITTAYNRMEPKV